MRPQPTAPQLFSPPIPNQDRLTDYQHSMGIKGLTKLIRDNCPGAIKETSLKGYTGMKVCIDASNALYQFMVAIRSMGQGGLASAQVNTKRPLLLTDLINCTGFSGLPLFFFLPYRRVFFLHATYVLGSHPFFLLCFVSPLLSSSQTPKVKLPHTSPVCLHVPFA